MKQCPVCQVKIGPRGTVYFSHGKPGTKARLYARVCQYASIPGCINDFEGEISENDTYKPLSF